LHYAAHAGVLTGGFTERELREAGAVAVYKDVAHLATEAKLNFG